jgi:hypothetical protein
MSLRTRRIDVLSTQIENPLKDIHRLVGTTVGFIKVLKLLDVEQRRFRSRFTYVSVYLTLCTKCGVHSESRSSALIKSKLNRYGCHKCASKQFKYVVNGNGFKVRVDL